MRVTTSILGFGLLSVAQCGFADSESIRFIIKYKHQPSALSLAKSHIVNLTQLPVKDMKPMANGAYSLVLASPKSAASDTAKVLEHLRQDPQLLYAVKDRVGYFKPVPDPTTSSFSDILSHQIQWDEFKRPAGVMLESEPGLRDGAWAHTTGKGKEPIVVAVLDTGVAFNDSLVNNLVKDDTGGIFGWNFAANNNDLSDETKSYHGTHVSGTIAGYGDVMMGMGEDLKVLTLKIPDASGMFYESAVVNAIYWSVGGDVPGVPKNNYPAKVLNMSFGVDERAGKEIDHCDEALQEAIFFARKKGAVLVAAAGNDNEWEHYNAPAGCNGTIKVASTGPHGLRSYFSNYGPTVTLAAPGGDKRYGKKGGILSTVNQGGGHNGSGFDFYQGTSMASPHVAGVAGLVFAVSGQSVRPERVEQILYVTTHEFGKSNNSTDSCVGEKPCGHGILDAENAVKAAMGSYDKLITAPRVTALATKSCDGDSIKPSASTIFDQGIHWTLIYAACVKGSDFQYPRIEKASDDRIYAYYGTAIYRLEQGKYGVCDVIGYDGVGCTL